MRQCPTCYRTYTDDTLTYCLTDGTLLSAVYDSQATQRFQSGPGSYPFPPTQMPPSQPLFSQPSSLAARQQGGIPRFVYIIVAALVVVIVGLVVALSLNGSKQSDSSSSSSSSSASKTTQPSASPASQQTPTPDLVATHKPSLISAIRYADNAEVESRRTLNPAPLYRAYTGEALRSELANIETLKSNQAYMEAVLESQDFKSFKVAPDASTAEVHVVERWRSAFYSTKTQECLSQIPSHEIPQTIYLQRGENGWIINAMIQDITTPEAEPCSK